MSFSCLNPITIGLGFSPFSPILLQNFSAVLLLTVVFMVLKMLSQLSMSHVILSSAVLTSSPASPTRCSTTLFCLCFLSLISMYNSLLITSFMSWILSSTFSLAVSTLSTLLSRSLTVSVVLTVALSTAFILPSRASTESSSLPALARQLSQLQLTAWYLSLSSRILKSSSDIQTVSRHTACIHSLHVLHWTLLDVFVTLFLHLMQGSFTFLVVCLSAILMALGLQLFAVLLFGLLSTSFTAVFWVGLLALPSFSFLETLHFLSLFFTVLSSSSYCDLQCYSYSITN